MSNRETGRYIAQLRKQKGLTQQQLADKLGVTNKAVSKWETGQGMPDISLLPALATALGTSIDAIVRGGVQVETAAPVEVAGTCSEEVREETAPDMGGTAVKPRRRVVTPRRVLGVFAILAGLLGAGLLLAFKRITQSTSIEYLFDWMPYLLAGLAGLLVLLGLVLVAGLGKKPALLALLCGTAACALVVAFGLTRPSTLRTQVEFSPDGGSVLVLKHNDDSGQTSLYRRRYGVLAAHSSDFPYTVNGPVKTQWLADDICAVTYQSPDGNLHQFVATYGHRSGSDSYVVNTLNTSWRCDLKNDTTGWELEVRSGREGEGGIVIRNGRSEELYTWSDCVQFGTLALALCRDGLPQWTIALNDDLRIDPVSHIAMQDSSIILCEVSMGKTMPVTFTTYARTASEPEIPYDNSETNREYGEQLRTQMLEILKEDPTLANFDDDGWMWKVETDEEDIFEIARLAFAIKATTDYGTGLETEEQITSMRLVGEGEGDWLVVIESRLAASSATERSTVDMRISYRIMRAEGNAYLVANPSTSVDATVGLNPPDVERYINTDGDDNYHFVSG